MKSFRSPAAGQDAHSDLDSGITFPVIPGSPEWWSRYWRRAAAIGAVTILLIGTHIPKLVIGQPGDGPDKLLHFFAFAMITLLLRISDLGRTTRRTAVIAGLLALFDEVTQEIPGLHRSFDLLDLVADAGGIAVALAWCRALGPPRRGSVAHHLESRRRFAAVRLLLASIQNWIHIGIAGAFGAMLGGVFLGVFGRNPVIGPVTMIVVGGMSGFIAGVVAVVEAGRRHSIRRIDAERRCLWCLQVLPDSNSGEEAVRCQCGTVDPGLPVTGGLRPRRVAFRIAGLLIVIAILAMLGYVILLRLGPAVPFLRRGLVWYTGLGASTSMAFDAIGLGLVGALLMGRSRRLAAIESESEGQHCFQCGQDLRGVSLDQTRGRCPECGAEFHAVWADSMAVTGSSGDNAER
ncbi:MAG: hypothetical protein CMJ23_02465 [Phycisphaerae bacterium]|nr:hypothetical protein [Phycisphaerae bacterium]